MTELSAEQVDRLVDLLNRYMKTGMSLDAAATEAQLLFGTDPKQCAHLEEALKVYNRRIRDIKYLSEPLTLSRSEHTTWYPGPMPSDLYWPALETYMIKTKGWDREETVRSIDTSSSRIISLLEFPGAQEFSTRGLVVGHVQSGKTANFTAVISKAADVGFRLFIILSGLTNSLRKQTQERLDEELVGRHPEKWVTWTDTGSDIGDLPFNVGSLLDSDRRNLAVVKKNGPRLRRLLRMICAADKKIRQQCPILIIDDESDQASVNASNVAGRITTINGLLREIIRELPRVAYIGYTATPYANVLINPEYPDDLYPRDFIVDLPAPLNYFGAERLFGRDLLDADEERSDREGLDMVRIVSDEEIQGLRPPSAAARFDFSLEITPSLREAILYYFLATSARSFRGDRGKPSSMLIHTTVYSDCHLQARGVVESFISAVSLSVVEADRGMLDEFAVLWAREQEALEPPLLGRRPIAFADLLPHLLDTIKSTTVVVENSRSDERLDFSQDDPDRGHRYIVIGGNVLARGLTIEGLISSFFVRTSSQYDSLMQMGRWFGFRPKYEDLPRIWMTTEMHDYFRDMALVEAEIRQDIAVYAKSSPPITPMEFMVRIREHPNLAITARGKMMAAEGCRVSFSGRHIQTRRFCHSDAAWLEANWEAASTLVTDLAHEKAGDHRVFRDVPVSRVVTFLRNYTIHEEHVELASDRLIKYIADQNDRDSQVLGLWNVVVVGSSGAKSGRELSGLGHVNTVIRSRLRNLTAGGAADIKALMSRADTIIDLGIHGSGQSWAALKECRKAAESNPLLLLYPINRQSPPRNSKKTLRVPLDAADEVLAMAIMFPEASVDTPIGYIRARSDSSAFEDAEYEEEELPEDLG